MSFTNVLLKHHGSLAAAGFLGGTAFGLYFTLQHGRAPFGLWGSSGKQVPQSREFTLSDKQACVMGTAAARASCSC